MRLDRLPDRLVPAQGLVKRDEPGIFRRVKNAAKIDLLPPPPALTNRPLEDALENLDRHRNFSGGNLGGDGGERALPSAERAGGV